MSPVKDGNPCITGYFPVNRLFFFIYKKCIEYIILDTATLEGFKVDVGAMKYGFEIDAIVGMDIFEQAKVVVNFCEMTLTPMVQAQ